MTIHDYFFRPVSERLDAVLLASSAIRTEGSIEGAAERIAPTFRRWCIAESAHLKGGSRMSSAIAGNILATAMAASEEDWRSFARDVATFAVETRGMPE